MAKELSPSSPLAGQEGARREAVGRRGGLLLERARQMRHDPTDAEAALWRLLRCKRLAGFKFKRQQKIGDYYIVDFVCFQERLIVEADGSQHGGSGYDARRDAWLRQQGFTILRFWNNDIDILARREGVLTAILASLQSGKDGVEPTLPLPLSPALPRKGGGSSKDVSLG